MTRVRPATPPDIIESTAAEIPSSPISIVILSIESSFQSVASLFQVLFLLAMIFEMSLMGTKVVEKEVKQRAIELNRANEELAQFVNVASHDLKAPLRGVAHLTRWTKDDLGENVADEVRENLDRLEVSEKYGCANSVYLGIFESG